MVTELSGVYVFNHLGLEEGIKNLEMMILQSSSKKMGIDWHLAYEELRRITQTMKLGLAKSKKKKKGAKGIHSHFIKSKRNKYASL